MRVDAGDSVAIGAIPRRLIRIGESLANHDPGSAGPFGLRGGSGQTEGG